MNDDIKEAAAGIVADAVAEKVSPVETGLQDHIEYTKNQFEAGQKQMESLEECIHKNAEAIEEVRQNTKAMAEAWSHLESVIKVGITVQKFGIWVVKWPVIGLGIYSIIRYIVPELPDLSKHD